MDSASKTTKCNECLLIFKQGETTCRRCQQPTVVLGSINSPRIGDPEYTEYDPLKHLPQQFTDEELTDQIMRRNPHRSRPVHPGAERYRRDS